MKWAGNTCAWSAGPVQDSFTLTDYLVKDSRLNQVEVCEADVKGAQEAILHGECHRAPGGHRPVRHFPGDRAQPPNSRADGPRGAPLWGDNRYGHGIPGQQIALWGYKLTFTHPITKEPMTFYDVPYAGHLDAVPGFAGHGRDNLPVISSKERTHEPTLFL